MSANGQIHTYYYFIDAKGAWFCGDNPVTDSNLLNLLSRSLKFDGRGHWVQCQGETHPVVVADASLIVTGLELEAAGRNLVRAEMVLNDDRRAALTGPCWIGRDNALFTRLEPSGLLARFNRRTFYQLTAFLQSRNDEFFLILAGREIKIGDQAPKTSDLR